MEQEIAKNNIWFGRDGTGVPRIKHFLAHANLGLTPHTLWAAEEVGTTDLAKKHLLRLLPEEQVFDTPKPESLLSRILGIATNPGDLVLDTFLGSATTAATAHKMGRRYFGVESGEHTVTHCVPRLRRVVDGEQGGISTEFGWKGGGGFDFFDLKPPIESASNGHRKAFTNSFNS
jgi:adenine-specific DNA-methyltransferase